VNQSQSMSGRRGIVIFNYTCLIIMNLCFYLVYSYEDMTHFVDAIGIFTFISVVFTFIRLHMKSGLWKLTHTKAEMLDERELHVTHSAISHAYSAFTVICLTIMLVHAVLFRCIAGMDLVITVPLVVSLIYFAHTLPGSILAWTETHVPGERG